MATGPGLGSPAAPPPEHADAVVIGSGFGGAVTAYRLAQSGLSVILLERGQAYPPDSFPRTPAEMSRAFWDPAAGSTGCSTSGASAAAIPWCRAGWAAARSSTRT